MPPRTRSGFIEVRSNKDRILEYEVSIGNASFAARRTRKTKGFSSLHDRSARVRIPMKLHKDSGSFGQDWQYLRKKR